jgi:hypothetical protein
MPMLSTMAMCFLWPYLLPQVLSLRVTGQTAIAYAVAFGLGLMTLVKPFPVAVIATGVFSYGLAHIGLSRSLRAFPWEIPDPDFPPPAGGDSFSVSLNDLWQGVVGQVTYVFGTYQGRARKAGWPAILIWPGAPELHLSRTDGFVLSLLAGWYACAANALEGSVDWDPQICTMVFLVLVIAALSRTTLYTIGHSSPISLFGRIATGRLIIPGYDRVFAAPLAAVLVARLLPASLGAMGLPIGMVVPITLSAALVPLLCAGPDLRDWSLSAPCQLLLRGILPAKLSKI